MTFVVRFLSAVNNSWSADHEDLTAVRSDYVVILAALFCALICAIGLAMVARCFCLHRRLDFSSIAPSHPAPPPPPPGLNKKTLRLLPTTKYGLGVNGGGNDKQTDCAICLAEFVDGDLMRILPRCGHFFHVACIDTWLLSHSSCPSCRQLVLVVARCHHCGGFSARQGFSTETQIVEREIDISRQEQDNVHGFLP